MSKILLITKEFPPSIGGAGMVAENTANLLCENHQITVLTSKNDRTRHAKFNLTEAKYVKKIFPFFLFIKFRKIYSEDYQTIILNDPGSAMLAAYFFTDEQKKKCLVYLHGSEPRIFTKFSFLNTLLRWRKKYTKLLYTVKKIIAVSDYMRDNFIEISNLIDLRSKMIVIYNGIDFSVFKEVATSLRIQYNINDNTNIILSVSRINTGKGYLNKYAIFKKLIEHDCHYHWIIAGNGPLLQTLKEMAKDDGLEKHITFVGNIERKELRNYYSAADIFWLLSDFDEALGLVYIEAIACNTPVIARNRAGVKEIVINNINGFLVENNEECYKILFDYKFYQLDATNLRRTISKFNNNNIRTILETEINGEEQN